MRRIPYYVLYATTMRMQREAVRSAAAVHKSAVLQKNRHRYYILYDFIIIYAYGEAKKNLLCLYIIIYSSRRVHITLYTRY